MCYIPARLRRLSKRQMDEPEIAANSLFQGVDGEANRILGTSDYRRGPEARALLATPPGRTQGADLAAAAFAIVSRNFSESLSSPARRISKENWRTHSPHTEYAANNTSPETLLERGLVKACVDAGRKDWWNQVPIASGLVSSTAGRRRAIDLVHERCCHAFDFVELKVESDSPIYAAIEVMQYGIVWLLTRQAKVALGYTAGTLLDGDEANLSVLAPTDFYGNAQLTAFQNGVSDSLRNISRSSGARMSFRFEQFRPDFDASRKYDGRELCSLLDERESR